MRSIGESEIETSIVEEIKFSANQRLDYTFVKIEGAFPEPDQQLTRITKLVQSLSNDLKKYHVYYPNPILKRSFVYEIAAEAYLTTANAVVGSIAHLDPETPMTEILELFNYVREFYDYCRELGVPQHLILDIQALFMPLINVWLSRTDSRWVDWVKRAYSLDQENGFEPIHSPRALNSSSVLDLFTAFQGGWSFLANFKFENKQQRDKLKGNFIRAMHKTLETYCKLIFYDFAEIDNAGNADMVSFTKEV
jgi:hypothetical protein